MGVFLIEKSYIKYNSYLYRLLFIHKFLCCLLVFCHIMTNKIKTKKLKNSKPKFGPFWSSLWLNFEVDIVFEIWLFLSLNFCWELLNDRREINQSGERIFFWVFMSWAPWKKVYRIRVQIRESIRKRCCMNKEMEISNNCYK